MVDKLTIVLLALVMIGCAKKVDPIVYTEEDIDTFARYEIKVTPLRKQTFESCMAGNRNKDVVYNDTNELAQSCRAYIYTVHPEVSYARYSEDSAIVRARVERRMAEIMVKEPPL